MELTINGKIEAWTQLRGMVIDCLKGGMCYHLMFIKDNYANYLRDEIQFDMRNMGKSRFDYMFTKGVKEPRIKYINNKIKQLENEKTNCR